MLIAFAWEPIDTIVGVAIGVFMVPRALRLGEGAPRVSQVAPVHVDVDAIRTDLGAIPGVVDVHDVHVWTLTSEMDVATAHVMVGADHRPPRRARPGPGAPRRRYDIAHATIQVEPDDHAGCADVTW